MTTRDDLPDTLRDARLSQALQHMPDAHMQASSHARLVVRHAAQEALGKAKTSATSANADAVGKRWWHAILGTAQNRRPWNAAFASVMIASFVTLLWQGKEIPDAKPDSEKISEAAADRPKAAPAATPVAPPFSVPATLPDVTNSAKVLAKESNVQSKAKRDDVALTDKKQTEKRTPEIGDRSQKSAEKTLTQANKPDAAAAGVPTPQAMAAAASAVAPRPTVAPVPAAATAPMAAPIASTRAAPAPAITQMTRRAETANAYSEADENADTRKKISPETSAPKESAGSFVKPPNRSAVIPTVRLQFEGQEKLVKTEKAQALLQGLRKLAQAASDKTEEKAEGLVRAPVGTDFMLSLDAGKEVWTYDAKTAQIYLRRYIGQSVGFQNESFQINAAQYAQLRGLLQAIQNE